MILVTGGTGLVGAHLLYNLVQKGDRVKAIHRRSSNLENVKRVFSYYSDDFEALYAQINWVEADIVDVPSLEKAFEGVSKVYHAAAVISFDPKDYLLMRKVNITGTANVVNLCIANAVEKLCFVSSIAAVEKSSKSAVIDETEEWNPELKKYGYAISKYGAEMEVWRGSQEGLDVVIVNPGVILGSGFWHSGPGEIFTKIYKGFSYYTEGVTGFVGVRDVVKAMVQLMEGTVVNERFILVSKNTSFKEVFFNIADAFGKKRPAFKVSIFLSEIAWRLEWLRSKLTGKAPLMTKHSARAAHKKYQFSSEKIERVLDFQFEELSKTIKEACSDYLKK